MLYLCVEYKYKKKISFNTERDTYLSNMYYKINFYQVRKG